MCVSKCSRAVFFNKRFFLLLCFTIATSSLSVAQDPEPTEIEIKGASLGETKGVTTYSSPVDQLELIPEVDVQSRGFAQAQADVSIRGNTFDQTGVLLGAVPFFDPQTGHYTFELPIPPHVFEPATVITDAGMSEQLALGAGGAVSYNLRPITEGGFAKTGIGDFRLNTQEISHGVTLAKTDLGLVSAEMSFSHSSSNGSLPNGGDEFFRYFSRLELSTDERDTQLLFGLQKKDIRWPDLYAPQALHDLVGSSGIEGDSLDTGLIALNHEQEFGKDDTLEVTAYYKHNHDDYDFDHFNPPLFNDYRHTSKVYAAGAIFTHDSDVGTFRTQAAVLGDELDSTSLIYGSYSSRVQGLASTTFSRADAVTSSTMLHTTIGVRGDSSSRNRDTLAPISHVDIERSFEDFTANVYAEYSQTSNVPGYTALNSNVDAGLFRGNPYLSRTVSKTSEAGLKVNQKHLSTKSAFFVRRDNDLVDWVYDPSLPDYAARSARNLDVTTYGFEQTLRGQFELGTLTAGYTYLEKDPNYDVDVTTTSQTASFYTGNFARNRIFTKAEIPVGESVQLLGTYEIRDQFPNSLREDRGNTYGIASLGARYQQNKQWAVEILVDNLGNESFEEVPGVPSSRRTEGVFGTINW